MQKCCGVIQFRITLSCVVSGRRCRGIAEKSGAALESGKSIYFRGVKSRRPVLKKQFSSADTVSICTLEEEARQKRYSLCIIYWRDSCAYSDAVFLFTMTVVCFSMH